MDTKQQENISLSELKIENFSSVHFLCHVEFQTELNYIIQDEYGRMVFQEKSVVEAGENELNFSVAGLKTGKYYVWIDVLGKTYIREFQVEHVEEKSLFGKIKYWLNCF